MDSAYDSQVNQTRDHFTLNGEISDKLIEAGFDMTMARGMLIEVRAALQESLSKSRRDLQNEMLLKFKPLEFKPAPYISTNKYKWVNVATIGLCAVSLLMVVACHTL